MHNMKNQIEKYIIDSVKIIGAKNNNHNLINPSLETELYGISGNLDSLSLVLLAVNVEELLSEKLGVEISLVDDKAISQRNSPFKTINSLIEYVINLISEQE